jgi:hypothetical protein
LQNATRFYAIQKVRKSEGSGFRQPYASPEEIKDTTLPLYRMKLGLFGGHKKQLVSVWVHLMICFSKIDKPQVTVKCLARAM